jgi:low temperature requirement protein LtrA
MLGAAVLAVTLDGGVAEDSATFAGTFGVLFLLLAMLYAYAGRSEPDAAELSRWYVSGSMTGSVLWFASLAVAPPGRYVLWALALALNAAISGPIAYARMTSAPRQVSHMPERFGLFVIVVLGEAVLAMVDGNTQTPWDSVSTVVAVLGFALAVGIWWVYFSNFDERLIDRALSEGRAAQGRSFVYGYGHLVLYAAIAAFGVGLELAIEESAEEAGTAVNWVAMGSIAVYLAMLTAAQLAVRHPLPGRLVAVRLGAAGLLPIMALVRAPVLPALIVATAALGVVVTLEYVRARTADVLPG